jgi:diadenosine tetraphosphatase ApaH/serine/threonine PP2A family protein phosphatase
VRTAILTDIHANREALAACLAYAARAGAQRYAFLGDLIGYGADPAWVVSTVMDHVARGAIAVRGNHDDAVVHGPSKRMNAAARRVVEWTRGQLNDAHLEFLAALPLEHEYQDELYVHANAWAPQEWAYVESAMEAKRSLNATRCRYTFCGHVHEPALYHLAQDGRAVHFEPEPGVAIPLGALRRWLAIPGSVGQPRDGVPAACYAIFDDAQRTLTYYRVPYDFGSAAEKIRAAGLPETFVVLLGDESHAR